MSDASVAEALRSEVQRVVVEAPAGTGKTHQAASYARDATTGLGKGQRVLILRIHIPPVTSFRRERPTLQDG